MIVGSSFLMAGVTKNLILPANLLSGGFLGIAIFGEMLGGLLKITIPTSLVLLLLNAPVAWFCAKTISKRFVFYSFMQVFLTSFFLNVLPRVDIFNEVILDVIFGGFLYGISIIIALKAGASSGGTDFIALYFANRDGREIWMQIFVFNTVMLVFFGWIFGFRLAGYSILFQFISTKTVATFHTRYKRVTVHIFTSKKDVVLKSYLKHFHHGITVLDGEGGYSKRKVSFLIAIISSYELNDLIHYLRKVDPEIIINITKSDNYIGSFYNKPIE